MTHKIIKKKKIRDISRLHTAQNTVISANFLVSKFCGKVEFTTPTLKYVGTNLKNCPVISLTHFSPVSHFYTP